MGSPSLIEAIAEYADGVVTRTAIRGMAQTVRNERVERKTIALAERLENSL